MQTLSLPRRLAVLALVSLLAGCSASLPAASQRSVAVDHVLFVWLNKPGDAEDRRRVIEATRRLAKQIPEVRSVEVGEMLPSPRPVVDSTYDVGIVMRFDDAASLARYQSNPAHVRALREELTPLARQIRIYDFELR